MLLTLARPVVGGFQSSLRLSGDPKVYVLFDIFCEVVIGDAPLVQGSFQNPWLEKFGLVQGSGIHSKTLAGRILLGAVP